MSTIPTRLTHFWEYTVAKADQAWNWLGKNHDQVTVTFAVIAGIYVLMEYKLNEVDATIKRAMELQARYGAAEILTSRLKLESYWLSPESESDLQQAGGSTKNEKITEVLLRHKLDGSVFVLADFFHQVTTCVKQNLCHLETTCAVFKRPAVELRNTYFDLFKQWEKRWGENLGDGPYKYFTANCPKD